MLVMEEILNLEPVKKIELIDKILQSLNLPNKELDELWIQESEARLKSYLAGKSKTTPLNDVLSKYR